MYKVNEQTGAIASVQIAEDGRNMNWLVETDGTQYSGITANYGWGLGYFTQETTGQKTRQVWEKPTSFLQNGNKVTYNTRAIQIEVTRTLIDGDVFPHYWSTLTAAVYHYYAMATGETDYQRRAENIVRNNLSLFTEDGRASCAYIYPNHVDGKKGQFYDAYANDQDWALCYYLDVFAN